MFQNIFSFDGRIRRLEFGLSYLAMSVLGQFLQFVRPSGDNKTLLFLFLLLYIPMMYIQFAQGTKRCHDLGRSGWYMLIPFYIFWMLFADGDYGPNEYGPNPKGLGNDDFDEIDSIGEEMETTQKL